MACSSGYSSGLTPNIMSSGSEEDLMHVMDEKKRKRMESNRESARRSRMRKQKHRNELTTRKAQLRAINDELLLKINFTTENLLKVEAENAVLWAQMAELGQRLESLNEILLYLDANGVGGDYGGMNGYNPNVGVIPSMMNNMMVAMMNYQPIIAAASDVFEYY